VLAVTGIYLVAADWLLAPRRPERRLLRVAHPRWHFGMLVAYGAIGAAVAGLMTLLQEANAGIEPLRGLALLGMSVLTIIKLVWFVLGRHDITAAFAGPAPGLVRRGAAHAYPWLLVALAMLLWVMECLSLNQTGPSDWYATARWTQILAFLIPLAAMGLHALSAAMLKRHEADGRPVVTAAFMAGRALATGAVWVGGLLVVTHLWSKALVGTDADGLAVGLDHALRLGLGVVAGWTLWTFAAAFFRIHLPPGGPAAFATGEETAQTAPATRLSTVLPLIRDVALGLVIAVTALLVLSALGLNIAPLLAGFGVFGLAISFGSQTLVRDIVSGIFFIADDAFRVGEYIDTGKLKGTVEKISLRSARLRHQNGQFHTMPFGQMQSITNYSRDWSVVKFELRFDLGVDVEKLRKTVKRVGLEMMEDPELAAQILQPLKMQGIQDVTETALVVRLKFTGRPGNPSLVQRDAMKRLLAAFRADNIDLAFNPANRSAPVLGAPYAPALIPETAVPAHAPG
jgi:moderate conductance mechanosensitive channel